MSRLARVVAVAVALTTVTAGTAWAHPAFNPGAVPPGRMTDVSLIVPHGCNPDGGMPEEAAASPTVEVAVQLPPAITMVDVHAADGWDVEVQETDGRVETITWTDAGGATTEPITFDLSLTADGSTGDEVFLSVYQGCDEGSFRWIASPTQDGEFPAAKLTLATPGEEVADNSEILEDAPEAEDHDEMSGDAPAADDPDGMSEGREGVAGDAAADRGEARDGGAAALLVVAGVVVLGGAALWVRGREAS